MNTLIKGSIIPIFCILFFHVNSFAQKEDKGNRIDESVRNPSITISLAPKYFSMPEIGIDSKTLFFNSWHLTGNFFLQNRTSFSTGMKVLFMNVEEDYSISGQNGYNGPVNLNHRINMLGLPLRLNYYIINRNNKRSFYIKTEFNNFFKIKKTEKSPDLNGDFGSIKESGYSNSFDFGFGLDCRLLDNYFLVFEAGRSFFISGFLPQYGLMEFQFGIKYVCKKLIIL